MPVRSRKRARVRTPEEEEGGGGEGGRASPVPMRVSDGRRAHDDPQHVPAKRGRVEGRRGAGGSGKKEVAFDPRFVDDGDSSEEEEGGGAKGLSLREKKRLELEEIGMRMDTTGLGEEEAIRRMLGFAGFQSTKGKKVEDNFRTAARGAVRKSQRRKHKQIMNLKKKPKMGIAAPMGMTMGVAMATKREK